jgi:hypothetical protein
MCVEGIGKGDIDRIDARLGDKRLVGPMSSLNPQVLGEFLSRRFVPRAHGGKMSMP